jgi:hypothetical protein
MRNDVIATAAVAPQHCCTCPGDRAGIPVVGFEPLASRPDDFQSFVGSAAGSASNSSVASEQCPRNFLMDTIA